MTQEERRIRRQEDTKRAVTLLVLAVVIIAAVIVGTVFAVGFFAKEDEQPANQNTQTQTESEVMVETEQQTEETETETEIVEIPVIDPLTQQAIEFVAGLSLEEKIAQMFMITPDALAGVNGATVVGNTTKRAYADYPVGGLVYESDNFETIPQTQAMLEAMQALSEEATGLPLFLSVEEEGGKKSAIASKSPIDVANISNMSAIGETGDNVKAYEAGGTIGAYLAEIGFNMDLAPVADVLSNENNEAMGNRSFGSDADVVKDMVVGVYDGLKEKGITPAIKYFPGYGCTDGDGSNGTVTTDKSLEALKVLELVPFQTAIDGGAEVIVVGHTSVPTVTGSTEPSSLSEVMISQVLREEMGFNGIVITDALNAKAITENYSSKDAAIEAVTAGADILLTPQNFKEAYEGLLEAVESGLISEEQINDSVVRIIKVKFEMMH